MCCVIHGILHTLRGPLLADRFDRRRQVKGSRRTPDCWELDRFNFVEAEPVDDRRDTAGRK